MPGRPRKVRDPDVLGYYLVDVLREVVDTHRWAPTLKGADLLFALEMVMNLYSIGPKARAHGSSRTGSSGVIAQSTVDGRKDSSCNTFSSR